MKTSSTTSSVLFVAYTLLSSYNTDAFVVSDPALTKASFTRLNAQIDNNNDVTCDRRKMLFKGFGSVLGVAAAVAGAPKQASASYSAYAAREKDWEERQEKGEIKISTARDLRAQLREIAPMNTEASYKFCPNGPSSNVSPLMENKCGDRLAAPSVFGRTDDIAGNSIPGFTNGGRYPSGVPGGTGSLSANPEIGGFPKY